MMDCKSMTTPITTNLKLLNDDSLEIQDVTLQRQIIGSLMSLTNMMPYIFFVVNTLSQYMEEPKHVHLIVEKHVMRYLKGTLDCGLTYVVDREFILCGYTDSDQAGSIEDIKSTSSCCFSLGSIVISSLSRNHTIVALSIEQKQYHFAICWQDCFMLRWMQLISIVTTRVASS